MSEHDDLEAKRIGRLIARLRLGKGWSQQDLAHEVKMHISTVSRWERGEHKGYAKNVSKLATVLGVEPSLLRPVAPELEDQLKRIEGKLDRVIVLLTPSGQVPVPGEGAGGLADRIAAADASPPPPAQPPPRSPRAAPRRKRA